MRPARSSTRRRYSSIRACEAAILTVQDRELQSLLELADDVETDSSAPGACYFLKVSATRVGMGGAAPLTAAVVPVAGVGRVEGAIATTHLLHRITPRRLFLVGVAGGFKANSVALGDVLVADRIVDYELQRLSDVGPELRLKDFPADERLLDAARTISRTMFARPTSPSESGGAAVHFGPVLSCDKVVASSVLVSSLLDVNPEFLGVEMEGAGVAAAVSRSSVQPQFLMIRGVVDFANDQKREDAAAWTERACATVARFTVATAIAARATST
jgi:nucleoside phosphorylase